MVRLSGAIYPIDVVLVDHKGLESHKKFMLNITLNETWYEDYLEQLAIVDELRIIWKPLGKITHISVFGEVDIKMNLTS